MDAAQLLERQIRFENASKAIEAEFSKNPADADNLTRWGDALVILAQFGTADESKKLLKDAVLKLGKAVDMSPTNHVALWCLGNAHTAIAFITPDHDAAKTQFDQASQCFQKAVQLCPGNEGYLKSLRSNARQERVLHKAMYITDGVGQVQQPLGVVFSSAEDCATNKKSDLKYDIFGCVILAVGLVAWIAMAKSNVPPPPFR